MKNFLQISWGISRGENTYGYNICRLDDTDTRKRYRCNGGGYDMIGTVVADWLEDVYQDRLLAIKDRAYGGSYERKDDSLYGMSLYAGKVSIDGACGISSVQRIAEAIGIKLQWVGNKKGHTTGYIAEDLGFTVPAQQATTQGEPA